MSNHHLRSEVAPCYDSRMITRAAPQRRSPPLLMIFLKLVPIEMTNGCRVLQAFQRKIRILKDDTEAHYPRSIHHLVHDIIQSFLAANGILQEIKTLDHINMHTSLRPRKLSTFIVIVRHDDEHGHHAARHSNVFVYSSPRHNYDKTSENTIRNSG